jgi:hypothetical protein
VQQAGVDLITINEHVQRAGESARETQRLREQLNELSERLAWMDANTVDRHKLALAEMKIRDLEARCELEQSVHRKLEADVHLMQVRLSVEIQN